MVVHGGYFVENLPPLRKRKLSQILAFQSKNVEDVVMDLCFGRAKVLQQIEDGTAVRIEGYQLSIEGGPLREIF
jgi:hypothetical protein